MSGLKRASARSKEFVSALRAGKRYLNKEEFGKAAKPLRLATRLEPSHLGALRALAEAQAGDGKRAQAERTRKRADRLEVKQLLAKAEKDRDERYMERSREALERVLEIDPDCAEAVWWLGDYWHEEGNKKKALGYYRRYLRHYPGDAEAEHMIAALRGRKAPKRASDEYVQTHFDSYAEDFDKSLVEELAYQAPRLIGRAVRKVAGANAPALDICDVGCGTGLVGLELHALAGRMEGVDLSPKMVALARKRGVYDRVTVGEITAFLRRHRARFDLVVAADVLIYFGDIRPLFRAVAGALRPGGLFAYSIETQRGGEFTLTPTGRYTHNPVWMRKVGAEVGLKESHHFNGRLRFELGRPVTGYFAVMSKVTTKKS